MQSKLLHCVVFVLALTVVTHHISWADENFSGTYHIPAGAGPALTLTLQQDDQGNATGTLDNGQIKFEVQGRLLQEGDNKGKMLAGTLRSDQLAMFFATQKQPTGQLEFVFIQAGADGKADLQKTSTVVFPAPGGATVAEAPPGAAPDEAPPGRTPAPVGGSFAGTFKSADMTVESQGQGGHYSGTIKFQGQTFKFVAAAGAAGLEGNFQSKEGQFPFTATLNGPTLTLTTAGTSYKLTQQNPKPPANPLAKPPAANPLARPQAANPLAGAHHTGTNPRPAAQPAATGHPAAPAVATVAWKTFKHPVGLSMRYPADWTIKETQGAIQLVPSTVGTTAQGPSEVYLVTGQPAGDIANAQDPRFEQAIVAIIGQLFPFLQRVGETAAVRAGNEPGIALQWEGTNPAGLRVQAQLFATVLKGFGISVLAVGDKNRIAAREKITRAIFTSLGAFEGEKDPQLVGNWHSSIVDNGALIKDAANRVTTTTASDSSTRYNLAADGTMAKVSHSRTIVNSPGVSLDTGDQYETTRGSWSAGEGKLVVFWENGTSNEWTYEVVPDTGQGRRIVLRAGNGGIILTAADN